MMVDVQTKSGRLIPGPPVNPRSASAVFSWLYEAAQAEANAIGRQHLDHPWLSQINVKNPTPDDFDTLNEYTFGTAAPVFDAGTGALINGRVAKVNSYSFKGAERYGYGGYYGEAKQETRGKLPQDNPIRRFEVFLAETALTQPLAIKYGYTEGTKRGVAWYVDLPQEEIVAYLLGCAFQVALAGRSPESISGVLALQVIENTRVEFAAFTLPLTKWEEARNSALLRFNPVYGKRLYRIFGLSVGDGETAPDVATMERGEDAPPYVGVVRIMAPQTQPVWMPVVAQRFPFAVTYAVDTERYGVTHIPTGLGTPIDVPGAVKGRVRSILTALGFLDLLIEYLGDKFGVTASFGDGSTIPAEEMRAAADVLRDRVYPMLASETGLAEVRALAAEAYPELAAFEREVAVEPVEGGGERAKPIRFKALTPGSSPAARALRSVTERAEWPDPLPADVAEYVEVAVDALVHKHFRGDRARAHASVIRFFSAIVDKDKERVRSFTNALEGKVFEKIFKALTGTHTNALVDSDPHRLDAEHERQKLHDARVEQERDATARKAAAAVTVEGVPGDVFVRERLPQALALLDGQWVNEPPLRALFAGGGPPQLNVDAPGKPFTSPRTVRLVEIPHPVRDDIYREIKAGRLTMPIVRVHTVYTRDFPQPGLIDAKYGEALRLVSGTVEIEPLSGPTFVFSHREVKPEVRRKLVAFDKSYDASDVRVAYVLEPKQNGPQHAWVDAPIPAAVVAASEPHTHPGGANVEVAGQISRLIVKIRTLEDEVRRTTAFNRKVELNSEINTLRKDLAALRLRVFEPAAPAAPEPSASDDDDAGAPAPAAAKVGVPGAADPIGAAVMPLRADAILSARQWAEKRIEWIREKLEAAGWDLDKVAPSPKGNMDRAAYMAAKRRRGNFLAVTRSVGPATRRYGDPDTREIDPQRVAKWTEEVEAETAAAYDAFVAKLREKIGPCTAASLEGSHVWGHSVLTVTKPDGSVERWQTQQIVNVSSLGKLFNQWPTRKLGPRERAKPATVAEPTPPPDRWGPPVWTVGKAGPGTLGHHENNPNFGYTLESVVGWGEDAPDDWIVYARDMRPEEPIWYVLGEQHDGTRAWMLSQGQRRDAPSRFPTVAAAHAYIAAHPAPPHMTDEAPP